MNELPWKCASGGGEREREIKVMCVKCQTYCPVMNGKRSTVRETSLFLSEVKSKFSHIHLDGKVEGRTAHTADRTG